MNAMDKYRFKKDERQLRIMLRQLPRSKAPPELIERVLVEIANHEARCQKIWSFWPAVVAPIAAAAALAAILIPRSSHTPPKVERGWERSLSALTTEADPEVERFKNSPSTLMALTHKVHFTDDNELPPPGKPWLSNDASSRFSLRLHPAYNHMNREVKRLQQRVKELTRKLESRGRRGSRRSR